MGIAIAIGSLWGFAEATLFFIVPDVGLTLLAIVGPRAAWTACAAAVGGALVGGLLMYRWGARDAEGANRVMQRLPAIDDREIGAVRDGVERSGFGAVFLGPLRGTPYKIYAVDVGRRGMSLPVFLLISVPARGLRFALATFVALWLAGGPLAAWSPQALAALAVGFWVLFYAAYFKAKAR